MTSGFRPLQPIGGDGAGLKRCPAKRVNIEQRIEAEPLKRSNDEDRCVATTFYGRKAMKRMKGIYLIISFLCAFLLAVALTNK